MTYGIVSVQVSVSFKSGALHITYDVNTVFQLLYLSLQQLQSVFPAMLSGE